MGSLEKQGLCNHCGVTTYLSESHYFHWLRTGTTQWRKGPPEKPVLCNACGSRYRLNGSLENHALTSHFRGPLPRRPRKLSDAIVQNEENVSSCASCSTGSADDTTANKYTSLSATSHLRNCTELKKVDGDQISGKSQPHLLDFSGFPARNRPGTTFSDLSHTESLQRDPVYTEVHDPEPEVSVSAEDVVLIYNANSLLVSPNEIGLGCVLLKPPSSNVNPKDGPTDESQA